MTLDEEAVFVLSYPSGDVLLVRQTVEGRCSSIELKSESIIPRFLSGIADKFRYVILQIKLLKTSNLLLLFFSVQKLMMEML